MKLWRDFYDLMMPDVPGCPSAAADSALRQSAIAFCEQSLAWQGTHPDVPVVAGTAEYAFTPPADAVVHTIIHAALDGEEIALYPDKPGMGSINRHGRKGIPAYILAGAASLTFVPAPSAPGTLSMTVAFKPSPVSTGIVDGQFNEYREAIVHGALVRLMLSPKKPYSSTQLAQYHQQQFAVKTAAAGQRVARGYTRARLQTRIMARGIEQAVK
ncbi:hypothetical protein [Nitrosospira sp. Nsp1]|uniref:phage adaptor protein n=1 Tax=Nitrosospira sp. Nsp1 TaxID=136547 RepID=UPI00088A8106|nr:hypothetical protein [Nitrosospira sp. Nsp1]SCX59911.1 hypothetical protein SAMN05720354_12426 [Nitrosospira sp. Nsp1]